MACLLACHLIDTNSAVKPKFVISVSGFEPTPPDLVKLIEKHGQNVRSLHLIGQSDTWVDPQRSVALSSIMKSQNVVHHPGG